MGLFSFNYNAPGPGINKNAPKKKGIFLYFEIFKRKISKLIPLNLLYFFCSLPMTLLYFLIFLYVESVFMPSFLGGQFSSLELSKLQVLLASFLAFCSLLTLGSGPASASMAYIMREFSKEEHVWLTSSFFEKLKENFKQEIIVALIDLVFVFSASFAACFYFNEYITTGKVIWFALLLLIGIISFIFTSMHCFIHQLIVTFDNKLSTVYKNALLFTLSKIPACILLIALVTGILYGLYNILNPIFTIALMVFLLTSFLRFPIEFYVNGAIKKILLNNMESPFEEEEEEPVFSDLHGSEK